MELPNLYRNVAFLPKRDLNESLEQFTIEKKWKENARIIDVGSGDGSTTTAVLLTHAPRSYTQIVGCDISSSMVQYANQHFANEKVSFFLHDITDDLPLHLKGAFDHAFSSYVIQRIKKQKATFSNIYDLLRPGGTCLHLILGRYPVYDAFRNLSREEKWASDLKDVEEFTSPYHDSQDPIKEIVDLMESTGFKEIEVKTMEKTHTYKDVDTLKGLIKSINPFHTLNDRWDDFMADYFKLVPLPGALTIDYQLIVAYGSKL